MLVFDLSYSTKSSFIIFTCCGSINMVEEYERFEICRRRSTQTNGGLWRGACTKIERGTLYYTVKCLSCFGCASLLYFPLLLILFYSMKI